MFSVVILASAVLSRCTPENTEIFKEWRQLTEFEKAQYVQAVVCLSKKPAQLKPDLKVAVPQRRLLNGQLLFPNGHPTPKSRLDDFTYARMRADDLNSSLKNHPQYLPWHRVFLRLFDTALRTECNYKGSLPYWDLSYDHSYYEAKRDHDTQKSRKTLTALNSMQPPDILNYFGTDERNSVNIRKFVPDKLVMPKVANRNLGPLTSSIPKEHYVTRGTFDYASVFYYPAGVQLLFQNRFYDDFRSSLLRLHEVALATGQGDIKEFLFAPNDPIFYLLQRNADRLWYEWQKKYGDYTYSGRSKVSLLDKMLFFGLHDAVKDISVGHALHPKSNYIPAIDGLMCFDYTTPITRPQ